MRGKVSVDEVNVFHGGITPAYAGKSTPITKPCSSKEDHPRVCGEKFSPLFYIHIILGSPPRMRGKAMGFPPTGKSLRITPAYAGKRPSIPD